LILLVRLAGIEPTTPWFVAKYSIQLSYSRERQNYSTGIINFGSPVALLYKPACLAVTGSVFSPVIPDGPIDISNRRQAARYGVAAIRSMARTRQPPSLKNYRRLSVAFVATALVRPLIEAK
jgi:hypothetical protein